MGHPVGIYFTFRLKRMSDKTCFQQFLDTKIRDNALLQSFSKYKLKRCIKLTFVYLFISTFTFLTYKSLPLNTNNEAMISEAFSDTNANILSDGMSYDCGELNKLYKEGKYEELSEKYPDVDHKWSMTTQIHKETVYFSRRQYFYLTESFNPTFSNKI